MFSYVEALKYIHGLNVFGTKLGLQNIFKLLEILGSPQDGMKIIHVAGTNGKGSTCSMIDSVLRAAGFNVGLYTSPFLEVFNERIRVNGVNIDDEDLSRITLEVKRAAEFMIDKKLGSPTEFEVVTAIGFVYFKEQNVDFLVLEVGMGGRLDATNVAKPLVSVITPISYDHQQYLGDTLADIAREKCGIIKAGIPVVTAPQEPEAMKVIENTCLERNSELFKVSGDIETGGDLIYEIKKDDFESRLFDLTSKSKKYMGLEVSLLGTHQVDNAATAVGAIEALGLSGNHIAPKAVQTGLKEAKWLGRLEVLHNDPVVLIDGAHNIAGVKSLRAALERYFSDKHKVLVLGILGDKDFAGMLKELVPLADTIVTTSPENPRALSAAELAEAITKIFPKTIINCDDIKRGACEGKISLYKKQNIDEAVKFACTLAKNDEMVVFAGSLYMIGSVRTAVMRAKD